jgi:hypothetical protein
MTMTSLAPVALEHTAATAATALLGRTAATGMLPAPGITAEDIECAWRGLSHMVRTPSRETLQEWQFHVDRGLVDEPDDGIIRKDGNDHKYFLHYRPDLPDLLAERGVIVEAWQDAWLLACDNIRTACIDAAWTLARELDEQLGQRYHLANRLRENSSRTVLRVLCYDPGEGTIAADHYDRDFVSLHVAASGPGLCAVQDGHYDPIREPQSEHVQAFAGIQLMQATDNIVLPLKHGVRTLSGFQRQRWAIVCFHYV